MCFPRHLLYILCLTSNYKQCIYSGIFIHLLLKIVCTLTINLELGGIYNILSVIICIVICQIYDIYYYIYCIYEKIVQYFFYYIEEGGLWIHLYFDAIWRAPETAWLSPELRGACDRFYFSYPFFVIVFLLRLFIIKEPLLFLIIHLSFTIFYLQDKHLFYTYIYLFTITK